MRVEGAEAAQGLAKLPIQRHSQGDSGRTFYCILIAWLNREPFLSRPVAVRMSARPSAGGPRPHVDGKFLAVGDERLWVAGVTYGTFAPGADGHGFGSRATVEADFEAMRANGINAVRTYAVPPRWLLDAALTHGLWVMVGLPWEQHVTFLDERGRAAAIEQRVRAGVRACAGHPAVLCFAIGNEVPAGVVRWHGRSRIEHFLERLQLAVKREDQGALVTYVNFPSTEYLELPFLDFVCFNVYLEQPERLSAYLARVQNLTDGRPLVLAEIGLDSRRNGLDSQAEAVGWQVSTAYEGGCAGTFVFAWTDEWHTGGAHVEDWDFGLTDRRRAPKPALAALRAAYAQLPFCASPDLPRISVVVCTHNGAATLDECLTGIARLDYPDYEVIVVDDGSADESADIAALHDVTLIRTDNRGLSAARNCGLEAASGEIVAYIDDDAWPDRQWLGYLARAFRQTDHAAVGGPNLPVPGEGPVAEAVANAPGGPVHVLLADTVAEHIPGCNMAFRRDRLAVIGGFDPQFSVAGDDVDVCWRLQKRGWTLGFHPAAAVWHHRRARVRGFWRQQRGYGRAEALLERKWPEKYNTPGHLTWGGRLYGRSVVRLRRSRVYYGVWGQEPFQSRIDHPQGALVALATAPEWYLVIIGLAATAALGALAPPLLAALPLLALAVALLLTQAVGRALRTAPPRSAGTRQRIAVGTLTGLLVLLQPAARLTGRMGHGLTPWRRAQASGFRVPRPCGRRRWYEQWRSFGERMAGLEGALRGSGMRVRRGGASDRWELEAAAGALGGVRLGAVLEEHGRGRQLLRSRLRPRVSRVTVRGASALAVVALTAALLAEWETAAVAAAVLAAMGVCVLLECGIAVGAALTAIDAARDTPRAAPVALAHARSPAGPQRRVVLEAEEQVA